MQNGSELAASRMRKDIYTLKPFSDVTINDIAFEVNVMSFLSDIKNVASSIIDAYRQGGVAQATSIVTEMQDEILKDKSVQIVTEINNIPITVDESLGYSPGSAINRPIENGSKYDYLFKLPTGSKKRIIRNGNVDETVKAMIDVVNKDAHLIKEASEQLFKSNTTKGTAKKLFDWIFRYLKYNLEEGEQLRNPLVTYDLGQRKAYNHYKNKGFWKRDYSVDCDDISIFIASVLKNLNIPYKFRIASYKDYLGIDRGFSHVYVVIPGSPEIIIDPVYHSFDKEKKYSKKKDFKMDKELAGIDVYYLSGNNQNLSKDVLSAISVLQPTIENENDVYNYLLRSKEIIEKSNAENHPMPLSELIKMYDYAIKYFWTDKRDEALAYLEKAENELISKGYIANNGLGGFFDKLKETAKNIASRVTKSSLVKSNYAKPAATDTVTKSGVVQISESRTGEKTLKNFIAKYRYPIAVGVGLTTAGISYAVYNNIKKGKNGTK